MKKDDILKKVQEEKNTLDERELSIHHRSFGFGMTVVAALCVGFSIIRALQGRRFFEFGVIIFAYLGAVHFYQYFKLRIRNSLFAGIACAIGAVAGLVAYFLLI